MLVFGSKFCRRDRAILSKYRKPLSTAAIHISDEVKEAILSGKPVVALESTIISHGMPYPRNLEVARLVEQTIRDYGAIPATIAIIGGIPKVGLGENDLLLLASNQHSKSVMKASTKDLAYVYATKANASTTVASTMRLASLAGIDVFATGGIGGVHRGAESSFDISADLTELSRTPVTVICAGVKSILDIPKTLEVLETNSVPVVSYGCDEFPAFYTNDSGIKTLKVQGAKEVAAMIFFSKRLYLSSGMVVGVPNPDPASSEKINYAIKFALNSSQNEGIKGPEITPYILAKIEQLTGGISLDSNVSLIVNNAKIAAQVAVEYRKLVSEGLEASTSSLLSSASAGSSDAVEQHSDHGDHFIANTTTGTGITMDATNGTASGDAAVTVHTDAEHTKDTKTRISSVQEVTEGDTVLVVGGALIDIVGRIANPTRMGTSNPGTMHTSYGGVGYNIASVLSSLGARVTLCTAIGDDIGGQSLLQSTRQAGMDTRHVRVVPSAVEDGFGQPPLHTATYNAIHDSSGELSVACADTRIFSRLDPHYIKSLVESVEKSAIVAVDGNIHPESLEVLVNICKHFSVPVLFEPTSDHKCLMPFHANVLSKIDIIKPNISELVRMTSYCLQNSLINSGRAQVANTLANVVAGRVDAAQGGSNPQLDEVDVRVLTRALYQQMLSSDSDNSRAVPGSPPRAVSGKHIIVSMGARGLIWCGPRHIICGAGHIAGRSALDGNDDLLQNVVVDEDSNSAMCSMAVVPIDSSLIKHTNGAGDSFVAGVLAEILAQRRVYVSSGDREASLPNAQCIRAGLIAAHRRLISNQ
jgi:pseudouridine-5'-phosphate glycosidase/pseudouridine kinase